MADIERKDQEINRRSEGDGGVHHVNKLSGMYKDWFLDYASYVILERAVPEIIDGLKPVHRRILHAMKELDDGRFNKVANIIGHTMKYHPHGDASIGDALIQLGQKNLLVDTQGNWGNMLTGDSAAAPRYIEARLSKFALEVVFNAKTTMWKVSYDGRNREPVFLPVKFPLLLAQGVEGIAVGLASKILPHNFNELIDASIRYLKGKSFELFPDFPTGGISDFSKYNDGKKGGRVRIRAKITQKDKKTLVISEIPYGTTTTSLIDSIVAANDKGKIKIKKIDDNTAQNVEIQIYLAQNVSPDQTMDALYAFTNCEISISPNACVIKDGKPAFTGVSDILKISTDTTVNLLRKELEIRLAELEEAWHFSSLEKIFIEERIYRKIENCTTWESILETIDKNLKPFYKRFMREVTRDDIIKLTEIRIKRISKYDSLKADEKIKEIENEMKEVQNHLDHIIDFTINYFKQIKKKYGKERERKTEIRNFDTIEASTVAAATHKLYVNRKEGFAGTSLKRDDYVCDCSDIDDIIAFREDGTFIVTKVAPKTFVGKNLFHIALFKRSDDRTIYNMIYRDGLKGRNYVKRFAVLGVTRDKEYDLTKGTKGTKVLYFTANPNGEAEIVKVNLKPKPRLKKLNFEFDFSLLDIKGRNARGNIITRYPVKNIIKKEEGSSTLGAIEIWVDETVKRLNTDRNGVKLGDFKGDDKIITIMKSGCFRITNYDLTTHFDDDMILIRKHDENIIFSAVYYEGELKKYYIKRFKISSDNPEYKRIGFIGENSKSELIALSLDHSPRIKVEYKVRKGKKSQEEEIINIAEFIDVKSYRAKGKRISNKPVKKIQLIDPLPCDESKEEDISEPNDNRVEKNNQQSINNKEDNNTENNNDTKTENGSWQMTLDF